jgi:hypothetical protein
MSSDPMGADYLDRLISRAAGQLPTLRPQWRWPGPAGADVTWANDTGPVDLAATDLGSIDLLPSTPQPRSDSPVARPAPVGSPPRSDRFPGPDRIWASADRGLPERWTGPDRARAAAPGADSTNQEPARPSVPLEAVTGASPGPSRAESPPPGLIGVTERQPGPRPGRELGPDADVPDQRQPNQIPVVKLSPTQLSLEPPPVDDLPVNRPSAEHRPVENFPVEDLSGDEPQLSYAAPEPARARRDSTRGPGPATGRSERSGPPDVTLTIGAIEVRMPLGPAPVPASPARSAPAAGPPVSLPTYLARRRRERAE